MKEYFVRYNVVAKTPVFKANLKTTEIERIRDIKEGYGSFIWSSYLVPSEFVEEIIENICNNRNCEKDELDIITLNLVF
jgi:hypothetical protein